MTRQHKVHDFLVTVDGVATERAEAALMLRLGPREGRANPRIPYEIRWRNFDYPDDDEKMAHAIVDEILESLAIHRDSDLDAQATILAEVVAGLDRARQGFEDAIDAAVTRERFE